MSQLRRPARVAAYLGLLAAIGLIGTYVGLVPLPIPEALALGALVAAFIGWRSKTTT